MFEQVLIRGVVMGGNAAGQKLVQPLMDNADGLRIWTDDKCLIPASDVATVVRCKDCKNYHEFISEHRCVIFNGANERPYPTDPDDFCSYGERKDNGK